MKFMFPPFIIASLNFSLFNASLLCPLVKLMPYGPSPCPFLLLLAVAALSLVLPVLVTHGATSC